MQVDKAVKIANGNQEVSRVDDSADTDGYQIVRNGRRANFQTTDSATFTVQNRFAVLQVDTEPEPDATLIGVLLAARITKSV